MKVFLDESRREHFGAALIKSSSWGNENMEKTDFCTNSIITALIWILWCLLVSKWAKFNVKFLPTCCVCAFLISPFWTMMRQPTFWRTWKLTRPTMCLWPQSIPTNQRARICWALRGHVRFLDPSCSVAMSLVNTVLLNRISVGSWPKE